MANARFNVAVLLCGCISFGVAAGPKPPPPEAPDLELLEYLVTDDEPAVPLPDPNGKTPPVKKP
jgi:hypothetical protein